MKKLVRSEGGKGGGADARKQRRTPAQRRARQHLGRFSGMWRELTQEQRAAWRLRADETDRLVRQGRYYRLSGQQLFNKINSVLALCENEPQTTPPPRPQFGPNPVEGLAITNAHGSITLKLSVPAAPQSQVTVYGAAPCSAGISFVRDFTILGPLPEPVSGVSDITDIYVARYGVLRVGTQIFIRTRQQINGWEDAPKQASAIVPKV